MTLQEWRKFLDAYGDGDTFSDIWVERTYQVLNDWAKQIEVLEILVRSLSRKIEYQDKQLNAIRALMQ